MLAATFARIGPLLALVPAAQAWTSSGCTGPKTRSELDIGLDADGHTTRTVDGGRTYLLHVPEGYDGSTALSLVVSFHGAGGTSARQEVLSQFSDPTARIASLPIIAAYPQGADNAAENRTGVWYSAPYNNKSVDDVQFAKDIVADIGSILCIDPHRVYAAGKSNGGGFVSYLACRQDTASLFAAFAPASPALYPESLAFPEDPSVRQGGEDYGTCDPGRAVPIINSHGVQDQTIPYLGRNDSAPPKGSGLYGEGTSTVNVPIWRGDWAIRNGCASSEPDVTQELYNGTTVQKWTAAQGCKADFVAYTTEYLGHSWPTTLGLDGSGAPNNTALFNFTDPAVLSFFTEHVLGEEWVAKNWS